MNAKRYEMSGPLIGDPLLVKPRRIRGAEDPKERPAPRAKSTPFLKFLGSIGSFELRRGLKTVIIITPSTIKKAPRAETIVKRSFSSNRPKTIAYEEFIAMNGDAPLTPRYL